MGSVISKSRTDRNSQKGLEVNLKNEKEAKKQKLVKYVKEVLKPRLMKYKEAAQTDESLRSMLAEAKLDLSQALTFANRDQFDEADKFIKKVEDLLASADAGTVVDWSNFEKDWTDIKKTCIDALDDFDKKIDALKKLLNSSNVDFMSNIAEKLEAIRNKSLKVPVVVAVREVDINYDDIDARTRLLKQLKDVVDNYITHLEKPPISNYVRGTDEYSQIFFKTDFNIAAMIISFKGFSTKISKYVNTST